MEIRRGSRRVECFKKCETCRLDTSKRSTRWKVRSFSFIKLKFKKISAHPKVKAFVTHSGFNSLLETSFHGKPVVIIPLFADQYSNAKRAERKGMAITIRKKQFNYNTLSHALNEILRNTRFIFMLIDL